ncbi:MAG: heavy metal translocating P-type ATPase, partial [Pirellulaceae bacterium]|nr:heavy metal translocating P-type ATPase [Pirellulaceae bacterium]
QLILPTDDHSDQSDIERQQQANERTWRYRAIVGMGLWLPLETLHWTASAMHWHGPWMSWMMFVGALVIIVFAGSEFYKSAWRAAMLGTTNMDTLISIGATTAFVYSTIVLVFGLDQMTYFAEACGLLGIVSLGHWFEARASSSAGSAVRELLRMQPETAEVLQSDGASKIIPSREVQAGAKLVVRPGGRIAVDGKVIEGHSAVDQSIVTGEPIPVEKNIGDSVVAGSMNTTGRLVIETSVDGRNTTVSRIAALVQRAQSSRAPIQRLADQVSSIFVPTVLTIASLTVAGWWLAGDFPKGVISAVTVLIISCPCALGLATPMAVMVGTGAASRRGILIRSAEALERIGRATRVVFDKTGTLTAGKPQVTALSPADNHTQEQLLQIAASVEFPSEHPIAQAIVNEATSRGLNLSPVQNFESLPGRGVQGLVDGRRIIVDRDANTTARVLVDGDCIGTLSLNDRLRSDAIDAVMELKQAGISVSILSGDRRSATQAIATELGLDANAVLSEATPESKAAHIQSLGKDVIMVGDGLNDAAALATSGLGIAMASGTNVAIEAAAVVIPGDRVAAIPELIQLSRATLRTIKQNLFFAFLYNALAIPLAAFGVLGDSGPLWAALAMGASDVTVVGNALWLKHKLSAVEPAQKLESPEKFPQG